MTQKAIEFQPGAMLHEVIVGAFRASGTTFDAWCTENGLTPSNGRNATFGQSRGEAGQRNLNKMIDAVGREFVRAAYLRRIDEHRAQLIKGAA